MKIHAIASLKNAAAAEVEALDVCNLSQNATDEAHSGHMSVYIEASRRASAALEEALNLIKENGEDLSDQEMDQVSLFILDEVDRIRKERIGRAIRASVAQRKMKEARLEREEAEKRAKLKAEAKKKAHLSLV